jgi:hypothetical protein
VDEILFRVLAEHVGGYLDRVERLAVRESGAVAIETRRLVAGWRALLDRHDPAGRRRCAGCGGRRGFCLAWRVACAYFAGADDPRSPA